MNSKRLAINLALILTISFLMPELSFARSKVKWYNFNKGMKLAKKLKRPAIIFFYASW